MIAKVLVTALFVRVVDGSGSSFGSLSCGTWDSNTHCYLKGVDSEADYADETYPAILAIGHYSASKADYHVCDKKNRVYKQIYLNKDLNLVLKDEGAATTIANLVVPDSKDESCFKVANVPTFVTDADCWTDHGVVGDEDVGGTMDDATSLVACKESCMLLTTCVAIHWNPDGVCYTRATLGSTTSTTGNEDGQLYERLRCARLPAALDTTTANSRYK
jgi:hypothetical protein